MAIKPPANRTKIPAKIGRPVATGMTRLKKCPPPAAPPRNRPKKPEAKPYPLQELRKRYVEPIVMRLMFKDPYLVNLTEVDISNARQQLFQALQRAARDGVIPATDDGVLFLISQGLHVTEGGKGIVDGLTEWISLLTTEKK